MNRTGQITASFGTAALVRLYREPTLTRGALAADLGTTVNTVDSRLQRLRFAFAPLPKRTSGKRGLSLTVRFQVHASRVDVSLIDRAAAITGKSRAAFVREAAEANARKILLSRKAL